MTLMRLFPLLGLALAACHTTPSSLSTLDHIPDSYTMRVAQRCFCQEDLLGPFDIEVKNGQAVSAVRVSDAQALPLEYVGDEIPDLARIHRILDNADPAKTHKRDVEWLKAPYVPKRIDIDGSERISDDEIEIRVERFELR